MAMLTHSQLMDIGFRTVGENVQISDKTSFYGVSQISLGSNLRIDDFCVIAAGVGGIAIGSYVHIAVGVTLIGAGEILISDFAGLSSRVAVYSSSDDYSGVCMTNPTVPSEFKNVIHADVFIGKHVIVGSGSVILPGIRLEDGVAIGALSLVTKDCQEFGIYSGVPARRVKSRSRDLLDMEAQLLSKTGKI